MSFPIRAAHVRVLGVHLTRSQDNENRGNWSPDGRWIVYTAADSVGSRNIDGMAVPAEGGMPVALAAGSGVQAEGRWKP